LKKKALERELKQLQSDLAQGGEKDKERVLKRFKALTEQLAEIG
jgi:hypothetical protein